MKDFNEDDAIKAMLAALPSETAAKYSCDDITEVLDLIFDYYDESGLLDIDCTDDEEEPDDEKEVADATEYVLKYIRKDPKSKIRPEDVETLVRAEYDYELSLI